MFCYAFCNSLYVLRTPSGPFGTDGRTPPVRTTRDGRRDKKSFEKHVFYYVVLIIFYYTSFVFLLFFAMSLLFFATFLLFFAMFSYVLHCLGDNSAPSRLVGTWIGGNRSYEPPELFKTYQDLRLR